jgi:hypothetical protein
MMSYELRVAPLRGISRLFLKILRSSTDSRVAAAPFIVTAGRDSEAAGKRKYRTFRMTSTLTD